MQTAKPYDLSLELYAGNTKQTGILYYAGDKDVYPLQIFLKSHGKPFPLQADTAAYITFRLPGGGVDKCPLEVTDPQRGGLRHRVVGSEIALPGVVEATVELQTATRRLTWQPFAFRVAAAADRNGSTPPAPYAEWTRDVNAAVTGLRTRVAQLEQGGAGGDGTGGGYSPYIDARTQTWWEYDDEACEYQDSGFPARGPQGEPGPAGADAAAVSVNGIGPVGGDIPLSAADIPYRNGGLDDIADVYAALNHLVATIGMLNGGLSSVLGV